jgi:hypothetical protein
MKTVRGYCPYLCEDRTISIQYIEVSMPKQLKPGYKKGDMSCDYYDDCTKLDEYNRCPIYVSAPSEP